jgi:hypothetical protein
LIGGSGAYGLYNNASGGGGGGCILIASASSIAVAGSIDVRGGNASSAGSSGAIRLIADQITGSGSLVAVDTYTNPGRIRIEASLLSTTLVINPNTVAVAPPTWPIIWPADNAPTATVLTVGGNVAPSDPTAPLISSADVGIQSNNSVDVIIRTTNFPTSGNVALRVNPKYSGPFTINATYLNGDSSAATWKATLTFNPGFSTLQAIATTP